MSVERSADAFERLADQVDRLSVNRHDPERFFEDRSEIVYRMREETRRLRAGITEDNLPVNHRAFRAQRSR